MKCSPCRNGISHPNCQRKDYARSQRFTINTNLIDLLEKRFKENFGRAPDHIARAPGRVNLLGEHVDYNDGFVMPVAIDRATYVAYSKALTDITHVVAADLNEEVLLTSGSVKTIKQVDGSALPEWGLYPAGVMQSMIDKNFSVGSIDCVFASDVPRGSGLSSSASVEMAFLTAWLDLGHLILPKMEKAKICLQAERTYVGVNCGIMDQFASACGVKNRLLYLDCRSLDWETLALSEEITLVVADTSVRRKLTSGGYNTRRSECEEAVRLLKSKLPEIKSLRDVNLEEFNQHSIFLPNAIQKRARHVIEEIDRTRRARGFLEAGDVIGFGRLVNECHASLRDLYEVSSQELNTMVEIAQSLDGCLGARLTGAGFGGCTVNLVESGKEFNYAANLAEKYQQLTGLVPEIYLTWASDGASMVIM